MKLSVMTLSALMAVSMNSTAQTETQQPESGNATRTQKDAFGKPSEMAREKHKQAKAEKDQETSQKILEAYRQKQDSLNHDADHCMTCGMG